MFFQTFSASTAQQLLFHQTIIFLRSYPLHLHLFIPYLSCFLHLLGKLTPLVFVYLSFSRYCPPSSETHLSNLNIYVEPTYIILCSTSSFTQCILHHVPKNNTIHISQTTIYLSNNFALLHCSVQCYTPATTDHVLPHLFHISTTLTCYLEFTLILHT